MGIFLFLWDLVLPFFHTPNAHLSNNISSPFIRCTHSLLQITSPTSPLKSTSIFLFEEYYEKNQEGERENHFHAQNETHIILVKLKNTFTYIPKYGKIFTFHKRANKLFLHYNHFIC